MVAFLRTNGIEASIPADRQLRAAYLDSNIVGFDPRNFNCDDETVIGLVDVDRRAPGKSVTTAQAVSLVRRADRGSPKDDQGRQVRVGFPCHTPSSYVDRNYRLFSSTSTYSASMTSSSGFGFPG